VTFDRRADAVWLRAIPRRWGLPQPSAVGVPPAKPGGGPPGRSLGRSLDGGPAARAKPGAWGWGTPGRRWRERVPPPLRLPLPQPWRPGVPHRLPDRPSTRSFLQPSARPLRETARQGRPTACRPSPRTTEPRSRTAPPARDLPSSAWPGARPRDAAYLGIWAAWTRPATLVIPDSRGTGDTVRRGPRVVWAFTRLAEDVEALRQHLGLERFPLLQPDAAAAIAQAYARRTATGSPHLVQWSHPARGCRASCRKTREISRRRAAEQSGAGAMVACTTARSPPLRRGQALLAEDRADGVRRWDEPQQAHAAAGRTS